VPRVLVATKVDMREDREVIERLQERGMKPVVSEEGRKLGESIGAVKYLECSAMTGNGLKNVFEEAVRAVISPDLCGVGIGKKDGKRKNKKEKKCSLF